MSYAKHTGNVAQQPDLFAAISVVCEQTIWYADHTKNNYTAIRFFAAVNVDLRFQKGQQAQRLHNN